MTDKKTDEMLEETDEIEVADHDIGKLNLFVYAVIASAALYYLFFHFSP